jgi:hypothetical protein
MDDWEDDLLALAEAPAKPKKKSKRKRKRECVKASNLEEPARPANKSGFTD